MYDPDDQKQFEDEQAALAICLLKNHAARHVVDAVTEKHFKDAKHRLIFNCVKRLRDATLPFDAVSVARTLQQEGDLDAAGGTPYLVSLLDSEALRRII